MNDCRFGVSPVNYPDPDPDPDVFNFILECSFNANVRRQHLQPY